MIPPIIIISRDRVTYLKGLVEWLESVGLGEEIHIVDNDSSYPPLLEYLESTPHTVHRTENYGPTSPWRIKDLEDVIAKSYFVVTDPDVYPAEECPADIIDRAYYVLSHKLGLDKVGPCLQIDDIPDSNPRKNAITRWEGPLWGMYNEQFGYWHAAIDTTFALCRPGTPYKITESVRLGRPYMFRHLPWYLDYSNLSEEDQYFADHASGASTWGRKTLPDILADLL